MATNYRDYLPNQDLLLPLALRDWLPEGHLALHVSDLVDELDLSAFHARYEAEDGRGNQAFDPRMMLKVLVYAYASGVFSSRKIASKLEEDVAFRVLGAGNFPSHRTVCDFRQRHLEDFKKAFVELGLLALLGSCASGSWVDGTCGRTEPATDGGSREARAQELPGDHADWSGSGRRRWRTCTGTGSGCRRRRTDGSSG